MNELDLPQILEQLRQSKTHDTRFNSTWTQGRTAFGGLSGALAVCGMEKILPSAQPIRSLMVSFIAPVPPGKVTVVPEIIRQGKNVTQLTSNLVVDDVICLQAMAVFGNSRSTLEITPDPQFNPEPRMGKYNLEGHSGKLPAFLHFFEGDWTGGGIPFSNSKDNRLGIWVKHRSDMSEFPNEKILSIADIPPPVILSHYDKPYVNASSLTWSLEFVVEPEDIKTDWFYLDFVVDHAAHGYTQQSGKVFSEDGRLCALSRQCMVYFD